MVIKCWILVSLETFSIRDGQFEKDTHYRIETTVGRGSFGVTYKATNISGSFNFCLKMCGYVKEEILALDQARKEEAKEIVKYYGAKLEGRKVLICMEYMEGGTLQQHIEGQREKLPVIAEETCFVFVRDILKGLAFLNSKGLVHGDIKSNLFARNYFRLEMIIIIIIIISLQIIFCLFAAINVVTRFRWQREPCHVDQPKQLSFSKISHNFERQRTPRQILHPR